jgi:cytochrome c oxidase assembly protein subunit 11
MTRKRVNLLMVRKLGVIVVGMFAFGYALVPLYRAICEITGINVLAAGEQNVPGAAGRVNTQVDSSRTVTVEFDANSRGVWAFKPAQRSVQVHPGELTTVLYTFRNSQPKVMRAQAIPSYAPKVSAGYFRKVECFCFNEYTLQPGESKQWPVAFVVDPNLPKDVTTITLSYTFFEVGKSFVRPPTAQVTPSAGAGGRA